MVKRFHFLSILFASFVATFFMTIFLMLCSVDLIKVLAGLGGLSRGASYALALCAHLGIGLVYGLSYALFFEPLFHKICKQFTGVVFALIPLSLYLFYGDIALEKIEKKLPHKESSIMATLSRGDHYVAHLTKKKYKMGYHRPQVIENKRFSSPSKPSFGVALVSHILFGATLSLVYRPKKSKLWSF
jgi:hypothetical protein